MMHDLISNVHSTLPMRVEDTWSKKSSKCFLHYVANYEQIRRVDKRTTKPVKGSDNRHEHLQTKPLTVNIAKQKKDDDLCAS